MIALIFALYRWNHRTFCIRSGDYCQRCDSEAKPMISAMIDLIVEAAALVCLWRATS